MDIVFKMIMYLDYESNSYEKINNCVMQALVLNIIIPFQKGEFPLITNKAPIF